MIILGLETSCDETAAAVVKNRRQILAHQVASSLPLHAQTGGIIPEVAARRQLEYLLPVLRKVLVQAFDWTPDRHVSNPPPIDAIAVTQGPGLAGSLLVGIESAKVLANLWHKKLIPINHLYAHLFANWLEKPPRNEPALPAIGLIISGGHTDLVYISEKTLFRWLGGTRDDAAGECFDKTARFLELGYPGGPAIEAAAGSGNEKNLASPLPRPMIDQPNFDFSFSGLKTAVVHYLNTNQPRREDVAAGIQNAITEVLVEKTLLAIKKYHPASLLLGGGVAANQFLVQAFRQRLDQEKQSISFFAPPPHFCTDNAAAIAAAGFFSSKQNFTQNIPVQPNAGFCV